MNVITLMLNDLRLRMYTGYNNFVNDFMRGFRAGDNDAIQRRTNNGNNNI